MKTSQMSRIEVSGAVQLLIIRMNGVRPEVGWRFIFRMIFLKEEKMK